MRDAFGGAFMIRLFLVFIFIYMVFTAIALNYAKAFKVKNKVVDYLEDNEIIDISSSYAEEIDKMNQYFEQEVLGGLNYHIDTERMSCDYEDDTLVYCENGIKINQFTANKSNKSNKLGTYYRVETYFTWNLRFLRKLMALTSNPQDGETSTGIWKIAGETKAIVKDI